MHYIIEFYSKNGTHELSSKIKFKKITFTIKRLFKWSVDPSKRFATSCIVLTILLITVIIPLLLTVSNSSLNQSNGDN